MAQIKVGDLTPRNQYTATSGQTAFTYAFPIFADADLKVYVGTTLKTLTTDYTVSGAGDDNGGTVTLVTGATTGDIITILRDMPVARTSDYQVNGDLLADTLNDDLDKLVMMAQQNESELSRKLGLQLDDEDATMTLPLKDTRATKLMGFDSNGDVAVSGSTMTDIDASVAAAFAGGVLATSYQFTGDGATVDFTITGGVTAIPNAQALIITIDGVTQHTDTYTTSGAVVTFSTAPPLNADIQVRYNAYLGTATDAASATYNQGGTGASSRTVENKLQESVSVLDFGAVGDGVTDDTVAIQAFFTHLENTGGVGTGGGGSYIFSTPLVIKHHNLQDISFTYKGSTASATAITVEEGGDNYGVCKWTNVGLSIDATSTNYVCGLRLRKALRSTFINISVSGATATNAVGLILEGATSNRFFNCTFSGNYIGMEFKYFLNPSNAVHVPANENKFFACTYTNEVNRGVQMLGDPTVTNQSQGNGNGFIACWFETNGAEGAYIENGNNWLFSNCRWENCTTNSIALISSGVNLGQGVSIDGMNNFASVIGTGAYQVKIGSTYQGVSITNNYFDTSFNKVDDASNNAQLRGNHNLTDVYPDIVVPSTTDGTVGATGWNLHRLDGVGAATDLYDLGLKTGFRYTQFNLLITSQKTGGAETWSRTFVGIVKTGVNTENYANAIVLTAQADGVVDASGSTQGDFTLTTTTLNNRVQIQIAKVGASTIDVVCKLEWLSVGADAISGLIIN